jgi:hypothetical protein
LGSVPIWRCGLRERISFWEFVRAHTIFDPHPVTYVPEEEYTKPLTDDEIEKLLAVREAQRIVGDTGQAQPAYRERRAVRRRRPLYQL